MHYMTYINKDIRIGSTPLENSTWGRQSPSTVVVNHDLSAIEGATNQSATFVDYFVAVAGLSEHNYD